MYYSHVSPTSTRGSGIIDRAGPLPHAQPSARMGPRAADPRRRQTQRRYVMSSDDRANSSNKTVIIVVSIVALVILLVIVACGGLAYLAIQGFSQAMSTMMQQIGDLQASIET